MTDSHQALPPGQVQPPPAAHINEKGPVMDRPYTRPLADQASNSDEEELYDDAQAGVKRIEATSTTWTKWSLYCAYAGYVQLID